MADSCELLADVSQGTNDKHNHISDVGNSCLGLDWESGLLNYGETVMETEIVQ